MGTGTTTAGTLLNFDINLEDIQKLADNYVEDNWKGKRTTPQDLRNGYIQGIIDLLTVAEEQAKIQFTDVSTENPLNQELSKGILPKVW